MLNETLKLISEQHDNKDLVLIRLTMGTAHRIDNCQIPSCKHDSSLYEVKSVERDEKTSAIILTLE